ncbi:MAG TPA: BglII/BstYI family type II restriction endonuclease [Planctomycetota bacterium]|nr:BglII/BstYI family type II restriction endonuclease [Planctomycetota bacterium]
MKISEFYSHLNGLEFLMVRKPGLWEEIQQVITAVSAEECKTKISKEARTSGEVFYSPVAMNACFRSLLKARGWNESRVSYWVTKDERLIRKTLTMPPDEQKREIEDAGQTPIYSYNQTDFVKDRVAVEVQFGKYAFVAYDLFVKHLAFYIGDRIDVGVEILPTKSLQKEMSSGVSYYEGELYNVVRQGRGVPAVPLILIGVQAD